MKPRLPERDEVLLGDNLELTPQFADGAFQLIYIDPPFNTGKAQTRRTLETIPDAGGDRTGFQGRRYRTRLLGPGLLPRRLRRLHLVPRAALRGGAAAVGRERHVLPPRRLSRGPLLQAGCWTRSSAARAFSTRSSGPTTTALARSAGGRPSTTRSSSTSRIPTATSSTPKPWTASRTWPRAWSPLRKPPRESSPPMSGGTRSFPRTARRRPAIRPRSRRGSCGGSWLPRAGKVIGVSTSSPAAARSGRSHEQMGRRFVLIDENPDALKVIESRLGLSAQSPTARI